MLSDSFLSDAGWLFFAAWSAVVAAVSLAAFGRDLLPSRLRLEQPPEVQPTDPAQSGQPGTR
ncbi:MAG: hypothetical protein ABSE40_01580 [Candidatus Sulfotelmatobacter sp.]|jgi:hypothetical protein|uniref:Uncharacterized protein n=1 Tax=Candidatus Sulfotelmatobacter kueseliae TaxID=2042962 RepID=A0A2U3JZF5_9BACT|nr:exported hypothetical protein [Candidatus Sulfotelmatobacter kueseliae]